jgi:hypothetical protein
MMPVQKIKNTVYDFDDFRSDYLGEYEAVCEMVLTCKSGTYMGVEWWKKPRVENLVTLSL